MTDAASRIKDFVLRYQPTEGISHVLGIVVANDDRGNTFSLTNTKHGEYERAVIVSGQRGGIEVTESCNNGDYTTVIRDNNGNGIIDKGDSCERTYFYLGTEHRRNCLNLGAGEIYQSILQKDFLDAIANIPKVTDGIPQEELEGKTGILVAGKDRLDAYFSPASSDYLREAVEKTKAIMAKVTPDLDKPKAVTFADTSEGNFSFSWEENVPTIYIPKKPMQGQNVLIGLILTVLNVSGEKLDGDGQRAIEMFTAYAEMRSDALTENLLAYLDHNKIYPTGFIPMMEKKILKQAEGYYEKAAELWNNDAFGEPVLQKLEEARKEIAKRPPPSGLDDSLALDELAKKIEGLSAKIQRFKKLVEEKNADEIVRLLKNDGVIDIEKIFEHVKNSGKFSSIKITDARWHQKGHLLLDVKFESDCGGNSRLLSSKTVTKDFSLYHLRRLDEDYGQYFSPDETQCSTKKLPFVNLSAGFRGAEYTRFLKHGESAFGGSKVQLQFYTGKPKLDYEGYVERGYAVLGWQPMLDRIEAGGGNMIGNRYGSFGAGVKLSYEREEFERGSPGNIFKLGYDLRARVYPFHKLPYLNRFSLGLNADIWLLLGIGFKDGWLNDVEWAPFSAAISAQAGVDF